MDDQFAVVGITSQLNITDRQNSKLQLPMYNALVLFFFFWENRLQNCVHP
jgi:hypothetical protein